MPGAMNFQRRKLENFKDLKFKFHNSNFTQDLIAFLKILPVGNERERHVTVADLQLVLVSNHVTKPEPVGVAHAFR